MEEVKFSVGDNDYYIAPVTSKILTEAQKVYNRSFQSSLKDGALLRKRLDRYMRDQNLWDDKREEEYSNLTKAIADVEYRLNKGGIKVNEARELAIKLREDRDTLRDLISERSYMDSLTAEGQADNQRFNYLVSACTMSGLTRKPVFTSMDDYLEKINDDLAIVCAQKFANYMYGLDENFDANLVENKFLKRFKFIDDKGRLINKDGQLISESGELIDEEGYRLKDGQRVDVNGNPILVDQNVDTAEFIDDEVKVEAEVVEKVEEVRADDVS